MKFTKRWKNIFIVVLLLIIAFIGVDTYIKFKFSTSYSNISYRYINADIQSFFKSIKYEENMTIEMMSIFFDSNNHVIGMDMYFSKEKESSNLIDRYKSSYNIQGAGLSNLYYTGLYGQEEINEKDILKDQIWKNATPKILKALSSFPFDEFYKVIPKANMYNIRIIDIVEMENNIYKNSWTNAYLVKNGSINKINSEGNFSGVYVIFSLKLDRPTNINQQVNDLLNENLEESYIIYLSLD